VRTGLAKGERVRWIAFALLAACGGTHFVPDGGAPPSPDLAPPPGPMSSAVLVLGGVDANSQWVDLTDGQDVTLVEGAQGGFHVWMKWRVSDMTGGTVTMQRTARRAEDGQLVLRTSGSVMVGAQQPYESPDPMPMFMCPSPIGLSVIDRPIIFRVELEGFVAKEITLVPHCPSDPNQNAFCMKICTG
jgi:hypothetical protein